MAIDHRPNMLNDAPMQYAPTNEMGVVFLFAHVAKRLQYRIEQIKPGFPDCIAWKPTGTGEKRVRIEFEYRSSNFRAHGHNSRQCDCLVCWEHDWPDIPRRIEVVELRRTYDRTRKVWIQPVIRSQWADLDARTQQKWGLSKRATEGDLLLMYRCAPAAEITDVFALIRPLVPGRAGWRPGKCYHGLIQRLCVLDTPLCLDDMRDHPVLRDSSFIRRNMQGNLLVSEYWPHLYQMIVDRNPKTKRLLKRYAPDML